MLSCLHCTPWSTWPAVKVLLTHAHCPLPALLRMCAPGENGSPRSAAVPASFWELLRPEGGTEEAGMARVQAAIQRRAPFQLRLQLAGKQQLHLSFRPASNDSLGPRIAIPSFVQMEDGQSSGSGGSDGSSSGGGSSGGGSSCALFHLRSLYFAIASEEVRSLAPMPWPGQQGKAHEAATVPAACPRICSNMR